MICRCVNGKSCATGQTPMKTKDFESRRPQNMNNVDKSQRRTFRVSNCSKFVKSSRKQTSVHINQTQPTVSGDLKVPRPTSSSCFLLCNLPPHTFHLFMLAWLQCHSCCHRCLRCYLLWEGGGGSEKSHTAKYNVLQTGLIIVPLTVAYLLFSDLNRISTCESSVVPAFQWSCVCTDITLLKFAKVHGLHTKAVCRDLMRTSWLHQK